MINEIDNSPPVIGLFDVAGFNEENSIKGPKIHIRISTTKQNPKDSF